MTNIISDVLSDLGEKTKHKAAEAHKGKNVLLNSITDIAISVSGEVVD